MEMKPSSEQLYNKRVFQEINCGLRVKFGLIMSQIIKHTNFLPQILLILS